MGLFTKKDKDGLPKYAGDLLEAMNHPDKKHVGDDDYYFRACKKGYDILVNDIFGKGAHPKDFDFSLLTDFAEPLAECYRKGKGCAVDLVAAFQALKTELDAMNLGIEKNLLDENTANHVPKVWRAISGYYMGGIGCERNPKEALKLFRMGYAFYQKSGDESGIYRSYWLMNVIAGWPWRVPMKEVKARALHLILLGGSSVFQYGAATLQAIEMLEQMDWRALGQSEAEDFRIFTEWAQRGNAYALYRLAGYYWDGIGVAKDPVKSVEYMEKAGETLWYATNKMLEYYSALGSLPDKKLAQELKTRCDRVQKNGSAILQMLANRYQPTYLSVLYDQVKELEE